VPAPLVHTIGHSTRAFHEVVGMLRQHGVDVLVDVRSFPASRAHPQWNQDAVVEALPDDLGYRWIRSLGGRRHTPAGTPTANDAWQVKAFRDYADHMATDDFRQGLEALIALAQESRPAVMCSEAVPWRCHRRLITDALLVAGVGVRHILSPASTREASLTPFAHVEDGRITYPAPPPVDRA
jgi:uncharacterized protein (DUF488 family)